MISSKTRVRQRILGADNTACKKLIIGISSKLKVFVL
jgi:hypothetical protein